MSQRSAALTQHVMYCTMIEYLKTWLELKTDRRAVTALEYALMAGVLALAVLAASSILGSGIDNAFRGLARVL
jgi:Flp pilus assembly pilin Flp